MNKNLDLKDILKECPKGEKFYSTVLGNVYFERIDELEEPNYPIRLKTCMGLITGVTNRGLDDFFYDGECTLFPSKDQRDWSKWHRPFIDGDVVTYENQIAIFKKYISEDSGLAECHVFLDIALDIDVEGGKYYVKDFATEEEKKRLFDVIREKGYTWNANDKKLEKTHKCTFDIKTLKPFDKVLVRDVNNEYWNVNLFGSYLRGWVSPFLCVGKEGYRQCIPYEGNEHLLGTTNDCDDFYKVWII